jgi:sugar phosphate permease
MRKGIFFMAAVTPPPTTDTGEYHGPTKRQAMIAFIILLVINILNYTDRSILSAVKEYIQADFGIDHTQLGLLDSSFLFIYGLATLPLGVWADKGVRKNIVAICVTIWSVATAVGGLTSHFIQLFISRAFLGVGEAGYAPASVSLIGDYFPKEIRGRMLSIWSTGNLFGTAIGLMAGGLIAKHFGWRPVFFLVGIPGLLAAFFIWRVAEPLRGASEREDGEPVDSGMHAHASLGKGFISSIRKLLSTPTYWVLIGAFICSFFITGAALSWLPYYLSVQFHLDSAQAGTLSAGALAGGSLIGTLLGGWLADTLQRRFPQGRMLVTAVAFLAGAPLAWLALSNHQNITIFTGVFICAIVFLSMCLGPIQAIIQDVTTPDVRSTAVGLALLLGHLLGDAASPTVIGIISDAKKASLGEAGSLGFALTATAPTCLLLAGLISLIGVFTVARDMRRMRERMQKQGE